MCQRELAKKKEEEERDYRFNGPRLGWSKHHGGLAKEEGGLQR
jgi:hypothetical protein